MEKTRVLIIDDHIATGFGTQVILEEQSDMYEVVGLATTGIQGIEMFEEFNPDLVILDFNLPGMSGDEITKRLREMDTDVLIVIYTGQEVDKSFLNRVFSAGANGILKKGAPADRMFRTLACLLDGEAVIPYDLIIHCFQAIEEPPSHFTERERLLIQYVSKGMTNTEIADALHLAPKTIENALTDLYKKLGVKGRAAVNESFLTEW